MLPAGTYLYSNAELTNIAPASKLANKRIVLYPHNGRELKNNSIGIPILGKTAQWRFLWTASGDFCIVSASHLFMGAKKGGVPPSTLNLRITMAQLPRKHVIRHIWARGMTFAMLVALIARGEQISTQDSSIHKLLFKELVLQRRHFLWYTKAHILRSVINAFGYNLVYCGGLTSCGAYFKVTSTRKRETYMQGMKAIIEPSCDMFRAVMENANGAYEASGFIHIQQSLIV